MPHTAQRSDHTHPFQINDANAGSLLHAVHAMEALERAYSIERADEVLARSVAERLDPTSRILRALDHAEQQQRTNQGDQLSMALWPFQPFSLTVGELLRSALAGIDPKHPRLAGLRFGMLSMGMGRLTLRQRLEQALAHVERHGQDREAMWPHQSFSLTYGELLRAARRSVA